MTDEGRGARRGRAAQVFVATATIAMAASLSSAAYFHEARRDGMLWLSDMALKQKSLVQQPVAEAPLAEEESSRIVAAPPAPGLFERNGGIRIPDGRCAGDDAAVKRCERTWEAGNLTRNKTAARRMGDTLTITPKSGAKLKLTDWETCSDIGECDGERFVFLGALPRSGALAVEIDYAHDSPSLLLASPENGSLALVHYGSEATFLNESQTLLVNVEDMNDATDLLVTRLDGAAPSIELQCLGKRTDSSSFGVTFKGWKGDAVFEAALLKAGKNFGVRFERGVSGSWTMNAEPTLKGEGWECRQRGTAQQPAAAPR